MNSNTDQANGNGGAQPQASGQPIVINAQYIKDLSFEAPTTPRIFSVLKDKAPDISINVDVRAQAIEGATFEVALHFKVECKAGDSVAFILELVYAGLFTLNVQQDHVHPVLLIECPRLLFPFARNIINDASRDGGFPPLLLGPIDFVAMYQNQLNQMNQQTPASGGDGPDTAQA